MKAALFVVMFMLTVYNSILLIGILHKMENTERNENGKFVKCLSENGYVCKNSKWTCVDTFILNNMLD